MNCGLDLNVLSDLLFRAAKRISATQILAAGLVCDVCATWQKSLRRSPGVNLEEVIRLRGESVPENTENAKWVVLLLLLLEYNPQGVPFKTRFPLQALNLDA